MKGDHCDRDSQEDPALISGRWRPEATWLSDSYSVGILTVSLREEDGVTNKPVPEPCLYRSCSNVVQVLYGMGPKTEVTAINDFVDMMKSSKPRKRYETDDLMVRETPMSLIV